MQQLHFRSKKRITLYNKHFSYLGNQNNPPDLIITNGDAIEIKKTESNSGNIALNSSFPKEELYKNSPMITKACRDCEPRWEEKDICYIIGSVDKDKFLKGLWFIYGNCYCANSETYTKGLITEP